MNTLDRILQGLARWRGRRVAVALSGGIDSALAAALLARAGATVLCIHLRIWRERVFDGPSDGCTPTEDAEHARAVAQHLDLPFEVLDVREPFRRIVVEPFVKAYLAGRTPNPCAVCNPRIKLGLLADRALAVGAVAVATGHYARVCENFRTGRVELAASANPHKDQSYYLFGLSQNQLRRLITPLEGLTRAQVRAEVGRMGLPVAERPGSVDICFLSGGDYRPLVHRMAGLVGHDLSGPIVDLQGRRLGRHQGVFHFTIGQRRGIGISAERPLYVIDIDPPSRTVVVGYEEQTLSAGLQLQRLHWVSRPPSDPSFHARVRIRYRHAGRPAIVHPARRPPVMVFEEPIRAVTPGQAAVAYDEAGRVLCGGWIDRRLPMNPHQSPP